MEKLTAMATLLLMAVAASAQTSQEVDKSIHFGIRTGLNVSKVIICDAVGEYAFGAVYGGDETKSRMGFHVGVIADIPAFKNYLYVTPGVYFTQKGGNYKCTVKVEDMYPELIELRKTGSFTSAKYEEKCNPMYLEIPILLSGRYTFGKVQVQVNFGPYIAIGLAGKYKDTGYKYYPNKGFDNFDYTADLFKKGTFLVTAHDSSGEDWDEEDEDEFPGYKRFDFGFSFGAGVTLAKHYYVGIEYELGLVDMYNSKWKKAKSYGSSHKATRNRNFMVTVGYNF